MICDGLHMLAAEWTKVFNPVVLSVYQARTHDRLENEVVPPRMYSTYVRSIGHAPPANVVETSSRNPRSPGFLHMHVFSVLFTFACFGAAVKTLPLGTYTGKKGSDLHPFAKKS